MIRRKYNGGKTGGLKEEMGAGDILRMRRIGMGWNGKKDVEGTGMLIAEEDLVKGDEGAEEGMIFKLMMGPEGVAAGSGLIGGGGHGDGGP
jgi:hypothetical protein